MKHLAFGSMLLLALGCGAAPLSDTGAVGHEVPDGEPTARPHDARPRAPVNVRLRGPDAPRPREELALEARIERNQALNEPVQVELALPPGVVLLEGERVQVLAANTQAQTDSVRYVIRADAIPEGDVTLIVRASGAGFGFRTVQPYRFGRAAQVPTPLRRDGTELRVGDKTFGRGVDITPR